MRTARLVVAGCLSVSLCAAGPAAVPAGAAFAGQNGSIAFHSNRTGHFEIYSMNEDGSGQTRLTNLGASSRAPEYSPDGGRIAFHSTSGSGHFQLFVMNVDGSGLTRLTHSPSQDTLAAWSPDGMQIAFMSDRNTGYWEVWVMNADGSNQHRLTFSNPTAADLAVVNCCSGAPDWSPDGSQIAFGGVRNGKWDIFVMNTDGSNVTRLTDDAPGCKFPTCSHHPDWSPDGSQIVYPSTNTPDGAMEIFVMNADGSGQRQLTHDHGFNELPAWSPQGNRIVFMSPRAGGSNQIYTMNPGGKDLTRLTTDVSNDGYPDWQALAEQAFD